MSMLGKWAFRTEYIKLTLGTLQIKYMSLIIPAYPMCVINVCYVKPSLRIENWQQHVIIACKQLLQRFGYLADQPNRVKRCCIEDLYHEMWQHCECIMSEHIAKQLCVSVLLQGVLQSRFMAVRLTSFADSNVMLTLLAETAANFATMVREPDRFPRPVTAKWTLFTCMANIGMVADHAQGRFSNASTCGYALKLRLK